MEEVGWRKVVRVGKGKVEKMDECWRSEVAFPEELDW